MPFTIRLYTRTTSSNSLNIKRTNLRPHKGKCSNEKFSHIDPIMSNEQLITLKVTYFTAND